MGALAKILGYLVLGLIGLAVINRLIQKSTTEPIATAVAIPEQARTEDPIVDRPTKPETPASNRVGTYSIGQQFLIGYWAYRINASGWRSILGDGFSIERANAAFLIVDITVQNNDRSSSTLPPFHLRDSDGREYDETSAGSFSDGFFDPIEQLNPGVSKRGYIAFDALPNRQYVLVASGGFESGEKATVSLAAPISPSETKPSESPQAVTQSSQPNPHPEPTAPAENATSASVPSQAVPHDASLTSGILCNGPIRVLQNGTIVFRDLPADRLHFIFDHDAWQPVIRRQADGRQTLVVRSLKPGIQTVCDIRWEIAP